MRFDLYAKFSTLVFNIKPKETWNLALVPTEDDQCKR